MAMEEQWMESTGEILPDGCKFIDNKIIFKKKSVTQSYANQ